jgi:hypothetical protein
MAILILVRWVAVPLRECPSDHPGTPEPVGSPSGIEARHVAHASILNQSFGMDIRRRSSRATKLRRVTFRLERYAPTRSQILYINYG